MVESRRDSVSQVSVPGYGVLMLMFTISGISRHHSRITSNWRRSQPGSAIMLIATITPSDRANSSASRFLETLTRLRNRLSPSSSIASTPRNMYCRPSFFQKRKTSLLRKQHVAAGLEVVLLLDPAAGDGLADGHAVLGLDERDVVDDEDAGLANLRQLVGGGFGALDPVAAAVERPGAAERAVPGAAARKLDRGTRVEHADEVLAAMPQQVAGGNQIVEVLDEARVRARRRWRVTTPGTSSKACDHPGARSPPAAGPTEASPSPLITQPIAPAACSSRSRAMNDALWPPAKTNARGQMAAASLARSTLRAHSPGSCRRRRSASGCHSRSSRSKFFAGSTCRSISRTSCPARRAACGDQLDSQRLEPEEDLGIHQATG